jgi:hypothetical protein
MLRCALAATLLTATACAPAESSRPAPEPLTASRVFDVSDLRFSDRELDLIARTRVQQARSRGIDSVKAASKVDALVTLESMLDAMPLAVDRFNAFARNAMWSDRSAWSALRRRSRRRFGGADAVSQRVQALLDEWDRQKLRIIAGDLENRQWVWNYSEQRWESEFHDFIRKRPLHAATWGWLVLGERGPEVRRQYGRSDAEYAYRFYLELTRLGTGEEARDLFSIPGIARDLH